MDGWMNIKYSFLFLSLCVPTSICSSQKEV